MRSGSDEGERYRPGDLDPPPRLEVATAGAFGGTYSVAGGKLLRYAAVAVPGEVRDTYGAGDSFAAGLTYGLASGMPSPNGRSEVRESLSAVGAETNRRSGGMLLAPKHPFRTPN